MTAADWPAFYIELYSGLGLTDYLPAVLDELQFGPPAGWPTGYARALAGARRAHQAEQAVAAAIRDIGADVELPDRIGWPPASAPRSRRAVA